MNDSPEGQGHLKQRGRRILLAMLFVLPLLYFGAPILLAAPIIRANGTVPRAVEKAFAPASWLYDHSQTYKDYIAWQRRKILGK